MFLYLFLYCVLLFFHVIIYVAMLCINCPRCGDCAFSASFLRSVYVSYVAGEGVELTLHKESVVVQEIEEVQLRSSYNRIGLQPRGHAPSRLPVKKLRRLLHKKRKVLKGVCMKGYPEKYHF